VKRLYTSHTSNCTICHRTPGKIFAPEFYSFFILYLSYRRKAKPCSNPLIHCYIKLQIIKPPLLVIFENQCMLTVKNLIFWITLM
jgi:hypothetical protein